jgi:PDZ domain-containing protein
MKRRLLYASMAAIVASALFIVPTPLFVLAPAPARPVHLPPGGSQGTKPAIAVEGATDEITGQLLLTTVSVAEATAVDGLLAAIDPYADVAFRQAVIPPQVDQREFFESQRSIFQESVKVAAAAGLRAAGREVVIDGDGARIVRVIPDAPAEEKLQQGDVVTALDGRQVQLASQLADRTAEAEQGERLTLAVQRDGQQVEVEVEVGQLPGLDQVGLGVLVETVDQRIELPADVEVTNVSSIGGPSAGLMLALTVYDLFDPGDLTRGRIIAGTGTIRPSGSVGEIGGIEEKVRGALLSDAEIFLAPAGQLEAARSAAPSELKVIGVKNLGEAIQALQP